MLFPNLKSHKVSLTRRVLRRIFDQLKPSYKKKKNLQDCTRFLIGFHASPVGKLLAMRKPITDFFEVIHIPT